MSTRSPKRSVQEEKDAFAANLRKQAEKMKEQPANAAKPKKGAC